MVDSFFCSLTPKTTIFGSYRVRICYHSLKTFKSKHFFDHLPQIPIRVKVGLGVGGRVGVGKATSKCCFWMRLIELRRQPERVVSDFDNAIGLVYLHHLVLVSHSSHSRIFCARGGCFRCIVYQFGLVDSIFFHVLFNFLTRIEVFL